MVRDHQLRMRGIFARVPSGAKPPAARAPHEEFDYEYAIPSHGR